MSGEKTIGIVAGAGPYAGLDLLAKILDQTLAATDQEHLTIISLSKPRLIPDRSEYLRGRANLNPAYAIVEQAILLEQIGADVVAIPCNTAHAPRIFEVVENELRASGSDVEFLHMIRETAQHLTSYHPQLNKVGVLSTTGTSQERIYPSILSEYGYDVIPPAPNIQEEAVHKAIYDREFGIKACGAATPQASELLHMASRHLADAGVEALILGCTELPLAIEADSLCGMPIIDPTLILARALINHAAPHKLEPWNHEQL